MIERITDANGNSFLPTRDQWRLHRAGWRMVNVKKTGCVKIVKWQQKGGQVWPQGYAIAIQRGRDRIARNKAGGAE